MADIRTPYAKEFDEKANEQLHNLLSQLPVLCNKYFGHIQRSKMIRTRLAYAQDLLSFYRFLAKLPKYNKPVLEFTSTDMDALTADEINEFLNFMAEPPADAFQRKSGNSSLARYLSSITSYLEYLYRHELIRRNIAILVEKPKLVESDIVYLEPHEVAALLECIENCDKTMEAGSQAQRYQRKTKQRDLAIASLFLGTGMRISELVGIDMEHLDFDEQTVHIYRKGGKEADLYFNDETKEALLFYINDSRISIAEKATEEHENALFLSMQGKRMTVRAMEIMIEKYREISGIKKHITPHKLRSTYGTQLNQATGDLLLVTNVLGHSSPNTARKHYTASKKSDYRRAGNAVTFREIQ